MSDLEVVNEAKNEAIRRAEIAEKRIVELEEANKTLFTMNNNMWVELEKKRAESQGITNKLHQLIKAKEIIKKLKVLYLSPVVTKDDVKQQDEILKETEQFLKDCDIDNAIQQANEGLDFDKIADEMEQDLKDSEVEK